MNVVAIICEYNPFHTGHKYQIDFIKKNISNPYIISLMSGNFVQRGDCAIIDKHSRADIALKNGSDLVIELPTFYCTQVAPIFALGAISILNSIKCVKYLCFGSETNHIDKLYTWAKNSHMDKKDVIDFKKILDIGNSHIKSLNMTTNIPSFSNDILAVEYIKAIIYTKSPISPYPIKRKDSKYNDKNLGRVYSSATSIRNNILDNFDLVCNYLPNNSINYYKYNYLKFDEDFFNLIKYNILIKKLEIEKIFEVNEGLENLILKNIIHCKTLKELISLTKSKRYTYTKIRRIFFNILLNITKNDINIIKYYEYKVPYIKILGFNNKGREIIKYIKKSSEVDIINKTANFKPLDEYSKMFFEKDILSNSIYNIPKKSYYYDDFLTSPIFLDK